MGLLDNWQDAETDDFALPNYDACFGNSSSASHSKQHSTSTPYYRPGSSGTQSTSASSTLGNSSSQNLTVLLDKFSFKRGSDAEFDASSNSDGSLPQSPTIATHPHPAHNFSFSHEPADTSSQQHQQHQEGHQQPPMASRMRRRKKSFAQPRVARRRAQSFDLFHEDEELQDAEPRITFCEICRRSCDIH